MVPTPDGGGNKSSADVATEAWLDDQSQAAVANSANDSSDDLAPYFRRWFDVGYHQGEWQFVMCDVPGG